MSNENAAGPPAAAAAVTNAQLRAWLNSECEEVIALGVDPELLAEALLIVTINRLAEAWSLQRLGRVAFLLGIHLLAEAGAVDDAAIAAIARGAR